MIVVLGLMLLVANPETAAVEPSEREEIALRRTAEIAIKSAEDELAGAASRSPLNERLLEAARQAVAEGRFEDAIGIARRVRVSVARRSESPRVTTTRPAVPAIESLYEALERLFAAENQHVGHPLLNAARELIAGAEAALEAGRITQADQLARRAVLMLAAMPPPERKPAVVADTRLISINAATLAQLMTAAGMTDEAARNLLWFRKYIGPLSSLDELRYIPGFTAEYIPIARMYFSL